MMGIEMERVSVGLTIAIYNGNNIAKKNYAETDYHYTATLWMRPPFGVYALGPIFYALIPGPKEQSYY